MKFATTTIDGAFVIDLEPVVDERGSFARAFCKREFAEHGIALDIAQCNLATTRHAGTVRGLHYQDGRNEAKLVRCVAGAVFDALVDMRSDSPTFRAAFWIRLDAMARRALFIPGGVAHGYQALEDASEFLYMTDRYYVPGQEKGVRFDDPFVSIPWPLPPRHVAGRDLTWPLMEAQP